MQGPSTIDGQAGTTTIPMASPVFTKERARVGVAAMEAAAFLLLWSLCVTIEGGLRFFATDPSNDLGTTLPGMPNRIALFVGGIAEIVFGFIGLVLGVGALLYRWVDPKVVRMSCLVQTVLGIYVFVTFVIVTPAYAIDAIGSSMGLEKFLGVLGLFSGISLCLALQGGQFVYMTRLYAASTGEDFLKARSGDNMRALFWNGNFALFGVWTFLIGAIYAGNREGPYVIGPNVGDAPGFTIFTGLVIMAWGAVGIAIASKPSLYIKPLYAAGTCVVFVVLYLNFTILQFSLAQSPPVHVPAAPIAVHTCLGFLITVLGPYFLHKSATAEKEMGGEEM